jgi:hypothetical protein
MLVSLKSLAVAPAIAGIAIVCGTAHADSIDKSKELPLYLARTLSAPAQDPGSPGNLWVGSGLPATNFIMQENLEAGVEVGIKAHYRQGHDILPSYVDPKGVVHVIVPAGPQVVDPAHGVPVAHPGRAAWNFTFSVNTALPGASPTLSNYEAELKIDLDPSEKTDYLTLKLTKLGPPAAAPSQINGYGWKTSKGITAIGDDEGTARVTQNSQNLAFYAALIDTNKQQPGIQPYTFGPGQFDVELSLRHKTGPELAKVHVVFDVVAP